MLRLTNLADYAVLLVCEIAKNKEKRFSAQELSDITSMPVPTVSKILNILSKSGLLVSYRGLKGGFTLACPKEDISLIDIIEAVDGPVKMTHCADSENEDCCDYTAICSVKPHWKLINNSVRSSLAAISLAEVIEPTSAITNMEAKLKNFKTDAAQ